MFFHSENSQVLVKFSKFRPINLYGNSLEWLITSLERVWEFYHQLVGKGYGKYLLKSTRRSHINQRKGQWLEFSRVSEQFVNYYNREGKKHCLMTKLWVTSEQSGSCTWGKTPEAGHQGKRGACEHREGISPQKFAVRERRSWMGGYMELEIFFKKKGADLRCNLRNLEVIVCSQIV